MKLPIRLSCLVLLAILALTSAHGQDDSKVREMMLKARHLLKTQQVGPDYKLSYLDVNGKPIDEAQWYKQAAKFDAVGVHTNTAAHTAELLVIDPQSLKMDTNIHLVPGQPIPPLPRTLLGKAQSIELHGRYTLISAFFSSCVGCIEEIPALNAYAKQHPEMGFASVTFDDGEEVARFVREHHLAWPIVYSAQPWLDQVGIQAYPTLLLVDPEGHLTATLRLESPPSAKQLAGLVDKARKAK